MAHAESQFKNLSRRLQEIMLQHGTHLDQVPTVSLRLKLLRGLDWCLQLQGSSVHTRIATSIADMLAYTERIAGGVYSDEEIVGAIRRGQIICHPLVPENINGSSLDVTLGGDGFFVANTNKSPWYNPRDKQQVERFFRFMQPTRHDEFCAKHGLELMPSVPKEALVIPIYPGERILAHTHEFVGILPPGTTSMQSRSTWGRNGVAVCIDAGWGDPGYATRWTMEIHNFNQEPLLLVVGERIAQIVFHKTGNVLRAYGGKSSKYHASDELQEVIDAWHPGMMLPQAYRDQYRAPLPIEPIPDYSMLSLEAEQ